MCVYLTIQNQAEQIMKKYYMCHVPFCLTMFSFLNFTSDLGDRAIHTLWYVQPQEGVLSFRKDPLFCSKCVSSPILNDLCTLYPSTALTSFRKKNAAELRQKSSEILIVGLTLSERAGTLASYSQDKFQLRVAVWGHKLSTIVGQKYSFL